MDDMFPPPMGGGSSVGGDGLTNLPPLHENFILKAVGNSLFLLFDEITELDTTNYKETWFLLKDSSAPTDPNDYEIKVIMQPDKSYVIQDANGNQTGTGTAELSNLATMELWSIEVPLGKNGITYYARQYPVNNEDGLQRQYDDGGICNALPDTPTSWTLLTAINADTTWTPPETGWYRIHVFGKCGSGGNDGGAGGNSGGYANSTLFIEDTESFACTVNGTITSFGELLSATSGGSGSWQASSVIGEATGGTNYNLNGYKGGGPSARGGNLGALAGKNSTYNGGGGGARLPSPYDGFPYIPDNLSEFHGGEGGYYKDENNHGYSAYSGDSYPALNLSAPKLYGGGNAGGGGKGTSSPNYPLIGYGSAGSPALIIIEKGAV